jgi:hypothetical protein
MNVSKDFFSQPPDARPGRAILLLRRISPATPAVRPHLYLQVSLNEEHVTCAIGIGHALRADLGERGHHYCLLTLARLRMDDARRGLDASSQGWIDNNALATMLGLDVAHMNIQIHRLRRQIDRALPAGVETVEVIERRRGEVRFGTLAVSVVRGSTHEGSYRPCHAAS